MSNIKYRFLGATAQPELLVVVDQFSRFSEVEITSTTPTGPTLEGSTKIFSTHGLPYKVITDKDSPFNRWGLKEYYEKKENHPKANSTVDNFIRNLNKTLRTAKIDGKPWKEAIFDFLLHYRITSHSTTLVSPSEALYNRKIRCKILVKDNELTQRDKLSKNKTKIYFDKRFGARVSNIKIGDLVRNQRLIN